MLAPDGRERLTVLQDPDTGIERAPQEPRKKATIQRNGNRCKPVRKYGNVTTASRVVITSYVQSASHLRLATEKQRKINRREGKIKHNHQERVSRR